MKFRKYLPAGAAVAFALGVTGASGPAFAQTTTTTATTTSTTTPASLPPDQIALNGSCIPADTIFQTAEEAIALYSPGATPAGLYINGYWAPAAAAAAFSGTLAVGSFGCTGAVPVPTTAATTTTTG